jgi:uncharacterized repeat protein (TIGR03843 family)
MREPPHRPRSRRRTGVPGEPADEGDPDAAALELLAKGALQVQGRLAVASNETFYCMVSHQAQAAACVYKPVAGERPLWDFPAGTLAGREVAAYQVCRVAGWRLVPPTVYRDGPFGPGMCQLWIDTDPDLDLIALARRTDHPGLRQMAVFDAVVNNADRKIGHLLPAPDGNLFGCDHGVCFGEDYKLRTVLWQWRGKSLPGHAVEALGRLKQAFAGDGASGGGASGESASGESAGGESASGESAGGGGASGESAGSGLGARLARWLAPGEVEATRQRINLLLKHRVHPYPPEDWPAVPWPPV